MNPSLRFLDHGGDMARRIREHDWSDNPLGTPDRWPQALRSALGICLGSSFPTAIYWGPDLRLLYNDAWAPIPAERHPWCLGRPAREVWGDIWSVIAPQFDEVLRTGKGIAAFDQLLPMVREGRPQDTWWNYSFTPIRDRDGAIAGVFNQGNETTRVVLAENARKSEVDRMRELFQQAPGAVALLHGPHHRFELANPAYLELVGARDLIGREVAEALPEVVAQGYVEVLDTVYRTGEAFRTTATPVELQRTADAPAETRILDFVFQPIKDARGNTTDIFIQATDVTERAEAETALRTSEERLQLALDASAGIGTWEWDGRTGRLRGDGRFARLFGVDPDRLAKGTTIEGFYQLVHPDDRERVRGAIESAVEKHETLSIEYRVLRPDGEVRWLLTQGRGFFDEAGMPVRFPGVSYDITARRANEDAARLAAEELRIANEAQTFIYALAERQRTLDTPAAIMRFTAAALAQRMGLDRVGFYRVIGDGILQFGPSWTNGSLPAMQGTMSVDILGSAVERYRSGRSVVTRDSQTDYPGTELAQLSPAAVGVPLLRGGSWVASLYANQAEPRDWTAEEVAFIEAVAEISWDAVERVSAAAALRESEEKFRAIANSIDQMIWATRPDGYHDYFNDRWYEYTGVPHGSTDGDMWAGVFHPDDEPRAVKLWRRCLETGEPYHIEYRLRHHSGHYRWVLGRAQAVRDEYGAITRWFGTCTDVQEIVDAREVLARSRQELEQAVEERTRQLMAAEEQLRQAQKMEAVGQLTGGIAHDFNNMLAVVVGALDLLERRLAQGQTDVDRYVTAARDGASRAAALTQRLLAFSRQQPLKPVPVSANDMVAGMIELLVRTLGEDVTVETILPRTVWHALADPNQLENVILNLAVNARDAMPQGGTLTIETANVTLREEDRAAYDLAPGDYVQIAVRDTGCGMPPDVAARAFEPFFTTKGVGKGTGLGLSQVFGFVRQSGGQIRVETAPGEGTTVRVYLPCYSGGQLPDAPAATARAAAPRARRGETILVVEDEDRVRSFSVEALRELGYTVIDARDGPEALRLLDRGQRATLLFTDMVMPDMTGRELAAKAREHIADLKVLFTTGYSRESEPAPDSDAGAVLAKPFDFDALAHRVRAAIDG
ncbi:PAS domain-containing protein [Sphingosinithalassobacter sp. CS137]|uniref:PAS domain-containing protein n=1 Tax=Sphingosinithalassobacter sp. CS137 TaxID=2762748 RepID=UPI0021D1BCDA|nr:PAS domain-containing protein [Sphingosinithalassobacter sp. CS137]